jgi:acetylornithine deacetylase/succinyl-diaminopimelate desuccinylase-like protein
LNLIGLTRSLVDIDSTTGREGEVAVWLAGFLRQRGYEVVEQPVTDGRFTLVAVDAVSGFGDDLYLEVKLWNRTLRPIASESLYAE